MYLTATNHRGPLACCVAIVIGFLATAGPSTAEGARDEQKRPAPVASPTPSLLPGFLAGPMAGVEEIVFAVRPVISEHWYANFGYYASPDDPRYFANGGRLYREGARLSLLNLKSGQVRNALVDPAGGIRDPQVSYDGRTILFSYRKRSSEHYHLYEIQPDGSGLHQLTDGPDDDIEPSYLPDGGIVFVSSRCHRWVNCWTTQVAVLYRCDADGSNIRPLSSNNEHDNTPWPLPDGRILYTRWEYVDRSQVNYHHLWAVGPDGSGQTVYFGNLYPGQVMIDAKPIPGSEKIVASFSPGHGRTEHAGAVTVVDPRAGPDEPARAHVICKGEFRDPWAFSEKAFLAARGSGLVLIDDSGTTQEIYRLSADDVREGMQCHEPRPLAPRPRERVLAARSKATRQTGRMVLTDVNSGRNMAGLRRGEVKKLLILETLPKPINFTGGMEPLSFGGTFTLERIVGTVPVEPDGSAYFEVPALRSLFFVALDEKDLGVKRMQSFVTVQPGETLSCVGCHEQRTRTPSAAAGPLAAMRRAPSEIEPVAGVPDVLDYPRDVQPVLDRHCAGCHDYGKREGGLILSGDRGPLYSHSYIALFARNLVADGRNLPQSNYPPRTLGSSASRLIGLLEPAHYNVQLSAAEKQTVRLWIDTGAPYPGTYAALGCGMIGGYAQNKLDRQDTEWPSTKGAVEALERRCSACHQKRTALPLSVSDDRNVPPWQSMAPDDARRRFSRHLLYNLTRPEKSLLLLAPLAREAGGYGICQDQGKAAAPPGKPVPPLFAATSDADYQKILAHIRQAQQRLESIRRFDMPGFRPRPEWVREMKRYGILPAALGPDEPINVYATEQRYWKSLWYRGDGE